MGGSVLISVKKRLANILCVWLPLLFLVAYVGSYYALVKVTPAFIPTQGLQMYYPDYGVSEGLRNTIDRFYLPVHQMDRKYIRPNTWKVSQP